MRIVVVGGSGGIGSAVAWDLARDPEVERVGLVGSRPGPLERVRGWIGSAKVIAHPLDVADRQATVALLREYDAGVLALRDRQADYQCVEHAIAARLDIVDVLEDYHRHPDPHETEGLAVAPGRTLDQYGGWLQEQAVANGVTILDGMGFAPGLSNITVGQGIRQLDRADTAIARVGGIPARAAAAAHPLRYTITWDFAHVLREYMIAARVIRHGQTIEVPAGADLETFRFREFGQDEELECAVTAGMPSIPYTRPQLREFAEKTIRWPGHWQGVQTLKECGLLELTPIAFAGTEVVPRAFCSAVVTPRLQRRPGETDVCVMHNTVTGSKGGRHVKVEYYLWVEAEPATGLSAMQRTTGFPAAIAARLLAQRKVAQKGIVAPEDAIAGALYGAFLDALEKRTIIIRESRTGLPGVP